MKNVMSFEEYSLNEGFSDIKQKVLNYIKTKFKVTRELINEVKAKFGHLSPSEIRQNIDVDSLKKSGKESIMLAGYLTILTNTGLSSFVPEYLQNWILATLVIYIVEKYLWPKLGY